ncbi:MAG: hypothetical protein PHX18_02875 [Candidatus Gastranaerophilales bacterium]|nr:hypothetical protein [Candidatus Gastranaerophilales bacterium]
MQINSVNLVDNRRNTAFKGLWKVKGAENALDNIAEALHSSSKHFSNHFQFLRIRLESSPLPPLAKALKYPSSQELIDNKSLQKIEDLLLDQISLRQHGRPVNNTPNGFVDLFVTNEDRINVETRMASILQDSYQTLKNNISEIMKKYFANKRKIDAGRPIEDFVVAALEKHTPVKVNNVLFYRNPNEVLSNINLGHFDFVQGVIT